MICEREGAMYIKICEARVNPTCRTQLKITPTRRLQNADPIYRVKCDLRQTAGCCHLANLVV